MTEAERMAARKDRARMSAEQFRNDVFSAVMQEVQKFTEGTAQVSFDSDEQAEVAAVFQRAIYHVQREHNEADRQKLLDDVEVLRNAKDR